MRLSLRFVIPLLLALGAFAYIAVPLADALMLRWFVRDLDMRSSLIASTVQEPLSGLILTGSTPRITTYFNRMLQDERLYAVGLCLDERERADRDEPVPAGDPLRRARRLRGRRRAPAALDAADCCTSRFAPSTATSRRMRAWCSSTT